MKSEKKLIKMAKHILELEDRHSKGEKITEQEIEEIVESLSIEEVLFIDDYIMKQVQK